MPSCYVSGPVAGFANMWLWSPQDALTLQPDALSLSPPPPQRPPCCDDDGGAPNDTRSTQEVTGWLVGGEDMMVLATFALIVLTSWILRAWFVSSAYNGVAPKLWSGAGKMSLGAAFALVALVVLLT
jgi:hypothetical protein